MKLGLIYILYFIYKVYNILYLNFLLYLCIELINKTYNMDIKGVIKAHGYTIEQVAKEWANVNGSTTSQSALSQSINNNPTIATLQKIANVIGCSVSDFFQDEVSSTYVVCPCCGKRIKIDLQDASSCRPTK